LPFVCACTCCWLFGKQKNSAEATRKAPSAKRCKQSKAQSVKQHQEQSNTEQNQDWDKETFDAKTYCNYKICFIGAKR
jgi:hypothetical protein